MAKFVLWLILLVLCWPAALLALILYPFVWLLLLPFRLLGIAVEGVFELPETITHELGAATLAEEFSVDDNGAVYANLRFAVTKSRYTAEEVREAAKLANADWFIRHLPQGYQTEVSEQGHNFSQGQRQLLAIARAILADPRILILDEATSSVDTRTEKQIQEALLRLMDGRTAFVIAHRLSTIRQADKLLVINHGRVIEQGTHDSLLAAKGFYYNLYMSQYSHLDKVPAKT